MKLLSEAHSAANQNTLGTLRGADMMMSMVVMVVLVAVVGLAGIRADQTAETANVIRG